MPCFCTALKKKDKELKIPPGAPLSRIRQNWRDHLRTEQHRRAQGLKSQLQEQADRVRKIGENLTRLVPKFPNRGTT